MILRHFFFDRESTVHGRPLRNQDSELTKQPLKIGRFAKMGLEILVVCRFDTGLIFIDTDRPTCHPPECHHNQGVNFSSVIFAIFSLRFGESVCINRN